MKIKYSPCNHNIDTIIEILDDNSITVDGDLFEFEIDSISFDEVNSQTNGIILNAYRDSENELYVEVRRFYKDTCVEWDTGEYHEISW